jgi:HK97 family phage prohead protease
MNRDEIIKARQERGLPNGPGRMAIHFASKLRAKLVQRDGKSFYELDGHATVFNTPYKMYDMFGEFYEEVDSTALDKSLAANPDVVFLLNHRGLSMARTTNGTLELNKDLEGLHMRAFLNADRLDVRDLASAVNDELITEMSFAFMIDDEGYSWNEDYTKLTLTEIDINRGDVSAVNYGANPYTDISARAPDIIRDLRELPAGALADAQDALNGVYAFAGNTLADEAARRFRAAGAMAQRGADARAEAMRDEGKTAEEISAAFPDTDFSKWDIVDETGEPDEREPAKPEERSPDVATHFELSVKRLRDIHITGDSE